MNLIILLLPLVAIFLMFRSQKKRQQQQQTMQATLQPGAGVRTIGGMYALVKAVNEETIELEIAPGVTTHFTKSAIAAVLEPLEYDAIINGRPAGDDEDVSADGAPADDPEAEDAEAQDAEAEDAEAQDTEADPDGATTEAEDKPLSLDKKADAAADGEAPESK